MDMSGAAALRRWALLAIHDFGHPHGTMLSSIIERGKPMNTLKLARIAVLLTGGVLVGIGEGLGLGHAQPSVEPSPPPVTTTVMATPAPAPGPVNATGGASGSSSPGSGCGLRLGIRNLPPWLSTPDVWAMNGDSGWPFGWPGMAPLSPNAIPSTAPPVSCSR
jgi:hypothetical protein